MTECVARVFSPQGYPGSDHLRGTRQQARIRDEGRRHDAQMAGGTNLSWFESNLRLPAK